MKAIVTALWMFRTAGQLIYEVIKNYDDDILYGYADRKDCAKFADFKAIVKDGIDSGDGFTWF